MFQDTIEQTQSLEEFNPIEKIEDENSTQLPDREEELSKALSEKSPILKAILRPNDNYTGMASLIDFYSVFVLGYGLGIAFVLWIIALIIKLKDFNNIFILMNFVGLVCMSLSSSPNIFVNKRLWGFWFCLIWCLLMIIYDLLLLKKLKTKI